MPIETWDEFRTAYQVARHGTVSGAADALGVHHATVIRHIDALERRLGAKLFQRHARGYTPTEAGRDLLATAERTEDQLTQLVARIRGQGEVVAGELTVTTVSGLAGILMPVFVRYAATYPDVTLRHVSDQRLLRLDHGEAHVAIRAGAKPEDPDYVVQPLITLEWILCAAPSYAKAHGLPSGPEDFGNHRFIGPIDLDSRAPFYRWLSVHVPPQTVHFRTGEPAATSEAVRSGLGLGFMPRRDAEAAGMIEVMAADNEWATPMWIVTHVDLHRSRKVQSFIAVLKEEAAGWSCR